MTRDVVYGRNAARELYRGPRQVLETWVTERAGGQIPWLDAGPRAQVKPERLLTEAVGTRDHQGIVAWCEPFRYADAYELAGKEDPLLVCLDQVTDPHNLGAVLRTAEAAGAHGVFVPDRRSVGLTGTVAKASAGALEHLRIGRVQNVSRLIEGLQAAGLWVYAVHPKTPRPYTALDLRGPVALVFGGEGQGIRLGVIEKCDDRASIPMRGRVESLNVSAAAAIVLFEVVRQRTG